MDVAHLEEAGNQGEVLACNEKTGIYNLSIVIGLYMNKA